MFSNAEERLLELIFQPNAPQGPGKTDKEYPEISLSDYLQDASIECHPGIRVTVGDFVKIGRDYAMRVLAGIVSADVSDDGENFSWYTSEKYGPRIRFEVGIDATVHYNECGDFLSPINYHSARRILPKVRFSTKGDDKNALVAWGQYRCDDNQSYFRTTAVVEATDVLLMVPWGGPRSQTRGLEEGHESAKFFERCVSKLDDKGFDYYILPAEGMIDELILTERDLNVCFENDEAMFFLKFFKMSMMISG